MNPIIREAELSDLQGICKVFADSWVTEEGKTEEDEVDYWTERVQESIQKEGRGSEEKHTYLVALGGKEVVGVMGFREKVHSTLLPFTKTDKSVEAYNLFVKRTHRKKGVGKMLMKAFIERVSGVGFKEIIFVSANRWRDAWIFHDKMGFERVGTIPQKSGEMMIYRMEL